MMLRWANCRYVPKPPPPRPRLAGEAASPRRRYHDPPSASRRYPTAEPDVYTIPAAATLAVYHAVEPRPAPV